VGRCEKKRGGGAGAGCPALAVAPAAGASPVVPDPWALSKTPASRVLPAVSRAQWRRLSGGALQ